MAQVRKLFGTDGIRGQAGVDLTESLARDLGAAAGRFAGPGRSILIGRDTRESGVALEAALIEGVVAAGAIAVSAGVIPTPGVAVLARETGAALGCVISASHNPYQDNGIKFLGGDGRKLADDDEAEIERLIDVDEGEGRGHAEQLADAGGRYIAWLAATYGDGVQPGFSIGIDCANGAAWSCGPALFELLGERVDRIGCVPDGRNINAGVGSTHLDAIAALVGGHGLDLGIAFDGDADRCLVVDDRGRAVNGDVILAVMAIDRHRRGLLAADTVVVTSMTNLGFHRLMRDNDIIVEVTDVGDRYVLERMLQTGATLGGEQSGHVVDLAHHTTGDGLATALMLLASLHRLGLSAAQANDMLRPFPQRLVAVPADRSLLPSADRIWQEVEALSEKLGENGRIVLRASGTEPLVRVMVEAEDEAECERICGYLAGLVETEIGA
ncbi:MAG TPA: phosphoglucosamine mutase [Gaiellales bacterium]|nr:phosphoglucosamine mutase [Gaiellales bacterium]